MVFARDWFSSRLSVCSSPHLAKPFSVSSNPVTQHKGHIIILRPDLDLNKYEKLEFVQKNKAHLTTLRQMLSFIKPEKYRGTGREHFEPAPFWVDDNGILQDWQDSNPEVYTNSDAKKQLAIYQDRNTPTDTLDDLCFYSLDEVKSVYDLIENKADYEILEILENEVETTDKTIGFDIGYIGGDFFSAIADAAIKPMWHPPDFDDMSDIKEQLKLLNDNCLFDNFENAKTYRELYLTKEWGEKEMHEGQITILQIRTV